MGTPVRQTNFLGGELDPRLWGRTDLPVFGRGARRMRNIFPSSRGAVSRPGTTFLGFTKSQANSPAHIRLVPFVYADSQSFVLEFGPNYVRFWSQGAQVVTAPLTPYEVATPFNDPNLLRFVQSGDVLTIVDSNYNNAPYELRRLGTTNWTLTLVKFSPLQPWFRVAKGLVVRQPPAFVFSTFATVPVVPPGDATHPARRWQWAATITAQEFGTGTIFETTAFVISKYYDGNDGDGGAAGKGAANQIALAAPQLLPVYADMPVTLKQGLTATAALDPNADGSGATYTCLAFNFYRGVDGIFGYLGSTTSDTFVDYGDAPDYSVQPPLGTNPFGTNEIPGAVAYYQDKLAFAGTLQRPNWVFLSASGDYRNFDPHNLPVAGESLALALASRKRELVRELVPHTKLLALTDTTVRSLSGSQGGPLDFDNIDSRVEMEVGCAQLGGALVVEGTVIFPRAKGIGAYGVTYEWRSQSYSGRDLSASAQHLFLGPKQPNGAGNLLAGAVNALTPRTIRSWTYAQDPWGLVWAVTGDGSLLSLTFDQAGGINAWARHDTDGWYFSIAAIPEAGPSGQMEDYVYVAVLRQLNGSQKLCIERMTSRVEYATVDDDICLDCAIRFQSAPTQTLNVGTGYIGKPVYVTGLNNPVFGPLTVDNGGNVHLPGMPVANSGTDAVLYAGLLFTPELELLDLAQGEARMKQKRVTQVGFEVDQSKGLSVGQDFEHLSPWRQRKVADSYGAMSNASDLVVTPVTGNYDRHARAALRQTLPLPVTVLGVTRLVDAGDNE